ncbi:MAG: hypothetical protein HY659_12385 [Rhizobiales bacterium]|nr:hypothetical protein [Hyphomicrobiales bacterium]
MQSGIGFRRYFRGTAIMLLAVAAMSPVAPGVAQLADPADKTTLPDNVDWNALVFDATTLNAPKTPGAPARRNLDTDAANWNRTEKPDGSAAVSVKRTLPSAWDSKVGVDLTVPPTDPAVRSEKPVTPASPDRGAGSAWANVGLPGASVEARVEAKDEQEKLGTKLSKSVPIGSDLSVTLQNGYSITHAAPSTAGTGVPGNSFIVPPPATTTSPGATAPVPPGGAQTFSTERAAKFNIAPTGTTISAGTAMSSTDEKWLRTFGAEQKLLGPLSVTGTVSETATGELNKSFTAGFKRSW